MRGYSSTKYGDHFRTSHTRNDYNDDDNIEYYLSKITKKINESVNRSVMHKVAVSEKIKKSLCHKEGLEEIKQKQNDDQMKRWESYLLKQKSLKKKFEKKNQEDNEYAEMMKSKKVEHEAKLKQSLTVIDKDRKNREKQILNK